MTDSWGTIHHCLMSWSAFGGAVLPLVGVALGTAGTVIGQHLSTRVVARRDERERQSMQRAERKEAIVAFLHAAEDMEFVLDRRLATDPLDAHSEGERMHALWVAKKILELVCSPDTAQAAQDYTMELNRYLRDGYVQGPDSPKRVLRHTFLEAARRELGLDAPPLRRDRPA